MCKKDAVEQGSRRLDLRRIIGKDDISPFLNRQASCASLIIHTNPLYPTIRALPYFGDCGSLHASYCGATQVGDLSTALGPRVDAALRKGDRSYSRPALPNQLILQCSPNTSPLSSQEQLPIHTTSRAALDPIGLIKCQFCDWDGFAVRCRRPRFCVLANDMPALSERRWSGLRRKRSPVTYAHGALKYGRHRLRKELR
jgi:hypothetical protein